MAIANIVKSITLDVYNHDKTPKTIKSIAADNDTRYIAAEIQCEGVRYDIGESAAVKLIIIRPDKVGVEINGIPYAFSYEIPPGSYDPETGEETSGETIFYYGVYAELDQSALIKSGTLLGQFKITSGEQVLRTELFKVNNGRALDAETSNWAGEYQGYNLDELVQTVNESSAKVDAMEQDVTELKSGLSEILEPYNLYDPSDTFIQTNSSGASRNGYTVNADGTITGIRTNGAYGALFLVNENKTLKAGTYTISCKITLNENATANNRIIVTRIGRATSNKNVPMTTERGGSTNITTSEFEGWIKSTFTLSADETFAFMVIPNDTGLTSSSKPYVISELQIEYGDVMHDYSPNNNTGVDLYARWNYSRLVDDMQNDSALTASDIFNAEPFTGTYDWQTPVVSYGALFKGKSNVESFAFFTDPHVMGFGDSNRNETRMENYLKRVQKVYNSTPCSFIVCGGDLLNNATTMDEACYRLGYIKGIFKHLLDGCKLVIGNHDTNYQGKEDSESDNYTGRLTVATLASILYRDTDTKKAYYSFDGANSKCYVLDTGIEHSSMLAYDWEQVDWLANKLKTDDADHSIIFLHIIVSSDTVQTNASNFGSLVEAYNNHAAITLNGVTYDFTACSGRVEFWVAGHTHRDSNGTLGGIPYFITASNSFNSDVPLIDLVLADYGNNVVKIIRAGGTGEDRTIQLT